MEFAITSLRDLLLKGIVAPAAAHEIAPVHACRVLFTMSGIGAEGTRIGVRFAVIRRLVQIDQVLLCDFIVLWVDSIEFGSAFVKTHLGGPVVSLLEFFAHRSERGQLVPAGFQATRTRYTMALAGYVDVVENTLK